MKTLRPINIKKGKTTNPNNSFFSEKKKRAARVACTHTILHGVQSNSTQAMYNNVHNFSCS